MAANKWPARVEECAATCQLASLPRSAIKSQPAPLFPLLSSLTLFRFAPRLVAPERRRVIQFVYWPTRQFLALLTSASCPNPTPFRANVFSEMASNRMAAMNEPVVVGRRRNRLLAGHLKLESSPRRRRHNCAYCGSQSRMPEPSAALVVTMFCPLSGPLRNPFAFEEEQRLPLELTFAILVLPLLLSNNQHRQKINWLIRIRG